MADLKFEGNFEGINEAQLEFIRSVLENRGYKHETVQVLTVGKADDNFVANVKRFVVEKDGVTFKIVGKIAPYVEAVRMNMNTKVMFYNEHLMYTEILPKYTELEIAAGIPENERLQYAACYGSNTEEPNEVLLLEDLQLAEFSILDKSKSLTDENIRLILKNFAILHSYSYVLKTQESETFDAFKIKLTNNWKAAMDMPEFKMIFNQLESEIVPLLGEEQKELVKGSLVNLPENNINNINANDPRYTVIIQGDPWTNNIMFKLKNGVALKCCMIDYQVSCENSPALDLEYMIFNCTDYEVRSKNYHQWINYYYKELEKSLSKFGLKAEEIYPREQLDADLKRFGRQCLGITLMMASMLMRESHEAANLKEAMGSIDPEELLAISKLENMEKSSLERFLNRASGLIMSFSELGYLDKK